MEAGKLRTNETVEKVEAQLWSGQTPSFEKEVVRGFSTVTTRTCTFIRGHVNMAERSLVQ